MNLIAWLLIALFPVLVLFSIFPNSSTVSVKLAGVSATGTLGAFIFVWWYGTRSGLSAKEMDKRKSEVVKQAKQIKALEKELRTYKESPKPQVLEGSTEYLYKVNGTAKRIGLLAGNLTDVRGIDVWVNSENTHMQMAAFFDRSISGLIRYLGATKDDHGKVIEDVISEALRRELELKGSLTVEPGTVIFTTPGALERTHDVKRLVHVAAVQGQAGRGFRQIADIGCGVTKVLQELDSNGAQMRSVVFPLMGAGQANADVENTIDSLYQAAVSYLKKHPKSSLQRVYFLTYTDRELVICKSALDASPLLTPIP